MSTKKYVSLSKLSTFLDNLKNTFAALGHKHTINDLTDYAVDTELSDTSINPVQNKVLNAKFDSVVVAVDTLEAAVDTKADIGHVHSYDDLTNKPFYDTRTRGSYIYMSSSNIVKPTTLTSDGTLYTGSVNSTSLALTKGNLYYVQDNSGNGDYCTCYSIYYKNGSNYIYYNCLGNPSLLSNLTTTYHMTNGDNLIDTGINWVLLVGNRTAYNTIIYSKSKNIYPQDFYNATGELVQLDEKVIPDTIARQVDVDTAISTKADASHNHDDAYYTEEEINTKIDALNASISGKADFSHIHDDIYYTETEIDEKIDEISSTVADLSNTASSNYNESIIGLSVDGTTVTYIKGDGSTHTFKTQDTDTTYSLGTDEVTGLTKLYATTGNAEDGTMTQKAIKTELDKKVGVAIDNAQDMLVFTV